jgi:transcriptional regulator with XRE-family HTH domain
MDATALGRTLRWARKRAGMTQHDLARAAGLTQANIARIEAGTVVPRSATLIGILHATGNQLAVEPIDPAVDREAIRRQLAMEVPKRTLKAGGRSILRQLRRFGVPFVLIGELAEVAHGSPATVGRDIEICIASTAVARERLNLALDKLPETDVERLRILTTTGAGDGYDLLVRNAVPLHVDAGILVRVAAIEDLIRARRACASPEGPEAAAVLGVIVEASRSSQVRQPPR